jgi:drug/metabolite transporter (DMT)-like permease
LQGPIGVLLTLVALGEWATTNPWLSLLAGFAVFASAVCFTIVTAKDDRRVHLRGVYLAAASGLGFGTVALINKYVTIEAGVYNQQVVWSFCIFLSLLVYALTRTPLAKVLRSAGRRDILLGLGAGLLYLGASFFMLQSFRFVEGAIAFTLIQLNAVWTILIGILVFKEVPVRRHVLRIILGFLWP